MTYIASYQTESGSFIKKWDWAKSLKKGAKAMKIKRNVQVGGIYLTNFGDGKTGSVIQGRRPVVVVRTESNSPLVHVVPLTTSKKRLNRMHVKITGCGLSRPSVALIEQVGAIDKSALDGCIGSLGGTKELRKILLGVFYFFEPDAA
jgi:mRNA-degrading endonuclease toxin of MazEF toxin-antitoxin module